MRTPITPSDLHPKVLSAPRQLTAQQLEQVTSIVGCSGNLRDQALLACMLSGLKPEDFLSAKVKQISTTAAGAFIEVDRERSSKNRSITLFRLSNFNSIYQHIKSANLSPEDLIFASDDNKKSPIASYQLRTLCASWAQKADIDAALVAPSILRYSSNLERTERLHNTQVSMGHENRCITQLYLKPDIYGCEPTDDED